MPWEVDERIKLTDGSLYRVFLYRSDPSQKPLRFSSQKRADEWAANEGVEAPPSISRKRKASGSAGAVAAVATPQQKRLHVNQDNGLF